MDIDFESAADVDIGSLDDDLDFFSTDKIIAPKAANGSADQWTFGQVCFSSSSPVSFRLALGLVTHRKFALLSADE